MLRQHHRVLDSEAFCPFIVGSSALPALPAFLTCEFALNFAKDLSCYVHYCLFTLSTGSRAFFVATARNLSWVSVSASLTRIKLTLQPLRTRPGDPGAVSPSDVSYHILARASTDEANFSCSGSGRRRSPFRSDHLLTQQPSLQFEVWTFYE